jgi:uncharacterized protein (DUF169 family)
MQVEVKDYSILDKFGFERKPVGVKYSLQRPCNIDQLGKKLALCELFKEAQTSPPFFVSQENIQCGEQLVGMKPFSTIMHSCSLGTMFSMFKNAQSNARIYEYMPRLADGSIKYITLASTDKMNFDPDILIITASVSQAEVILRASSYDNGRMWSNKGTTCLACAWIYAYPYISGEINYTITGLGYSMKSRRVLPEGLFLISIPNDKISPLFANLKEMDWHPEWFDMGREEFINQVGIRTAKLLKEIQ